MRTSLLIALFLGAWAAPAAADEPASRADVVPLVLVADPMFGMESGVRTSTSLRRVVFLHDEPLRRLWSPLDEVRPLDKAAGVAGRLFKLVLIDWPLVSLEGTVLHEAYGHGFRGREAGQRPYYELDLPFPYRLLSGRIGSSGYAHDVYSGILEYDMPMVAGGIEANHLNAHWLNLDTLRRGGRMHYSDGLAYLYSKMSYASVLLSDLSRPSDDSGDPGMYVGQLQQRFNLWTDGGRAGISADLRRAYWLSFVDPSLWVCLYHVLYSYLFVGRSYGDLPLLDAGGWKLWPGTRFNLSPFGAEHYLDVLAGHQGLVADVYLRAVSSGLASAWGAGARVLGYPIREGITAGAELDLWYQPEILLDQRFVFERGELLGANAGVHVDVRVFGPLGVTGKLAVKTKGYMMGLPLGAGVHGYLGLSVALDPLAAPPAPSAR